MKKLMVPGIGLALGILGGTAWTVASYAPPVAAAVDSTAVEAMDEATSDSTSAGAGQDGDAVLAVADVDEPAAAEAAGDSLTEPDSATVEAPNAPEADGDAPAPSQVADGSDAGVVEGDAAGEGGATDEPAVDAVPTDGAAVQAGGGAVAGAGANRRPAAQPDSAMDEKALQLARVFEAMQPKDAARVLSQLRDDEIEMVLVRMGSRKAAAVLSNLEPARAAVLTRAVLGSH